LERAPLILLAGYFGHGNAGDELILRLLRDALGPVGDPGVRYLSGPRPTFPGAVPRENPRALFAALRDARALVLGGGELFQTRTSRRSLAAYLGLPVAMSLRGKPFWVFGVGIDPELPSLALRATATVLRRARGVWARDAASRAALARHGVRCALMDDTVWALPVPPIEPPSPHGRRILWIPRFPDGEGTVRRLTPLLAGLPGFDHALLPLHPAHDDVFVEKLRARGPAVRWDGDTPDEIPRRLAEADVVVTMRYHGLVLAALAGRPAVALAAHGKVAQLARDLGVPVVEPRAWSVAALSAAVRDASARPPADPAPRAASARAALAELARELSSVPH
jgi:polysaccharide pyruvyl transferase CsaB